jgi:hypothetical protein
MYKNEIDSSYYIMISLPKYEQKAKNAPARQNPHLFL